MVVCIDYNHEDIVYIGKDCPFCLALKEIEDLKLQIEKLESSQT